jgi:carbon-monoxide dehydrogenase medium subunit
MLAASPVLPAALREAAGNVGDWQVRNMGTIGGNVSHADPASDHPTVLTALGATFRAARASGTRSISPLEFFTGIFNTALDAQELLTAIEVPVNKKGTGSAYAKMSHPASGYALLGAAAVVALEDGICTEASVALGGLTQKATKAPSVEAALLGKRLDDAAISAAAEAVADDLGGEILGDIHASSGYLRAMAPVFVRRALAQAADRAGQ